MKDNTRLLNIIQRSPFYILLKRILPPKIKSFLFLNFLKITKLDLEFLYDERFVKNRLDKTRWAEEFCNLFIGMFSPRSIVDFGCGMGDFLYWFEKKGVDILGIDGSSACRRYAKFDKRKFILFDLRRFYKTEKRFDLCFCLEVGEHIHQKYSDNLVDNLIGSSDVVIFSAAVPGQGGYDHCNEKPKDWWIEKFNKRHFRLDGKCTNILCEKISKIPGCEHYYAKNLMVFKKDPSF